MVASAIESLLSCAQEALDPPVCRVFQNPGGTAPHDNCQSSEDGNGQLWVGHTGSQPGWPSPTADPITCATEWSETIQIGVVRCAEGKLGDDNNVPDAELVTNDAVQQQLDRIALRNAILCCFPIEGRDMIVQGWEAVDPLGGCVGGFWTIVIKDSGCDCSNWEP